MKFTWLGHTHKKKNNEIKIVHFTVHVVAMQITLWNVIICTVSHL